MNQFNHKDIFNNTHVAISRAISLIENSDDSASTLFEFFQEANETGYKLSNEFLGALGAIGVSRNNETAV